MNEPLGMLAYELIIELLIASTLIWLITKASTRLLGIDNSTWMVRFSALPVVLPIVSVPLIHLLIRPNIIHLSSSPIEELLIAAAWQAPLTNTFFIAVGAVLLAFSASYLFHPVAAVVRCWYDWRRQKKGDLWERCNGFVLTAASKLRTKPARLILKANEGCGSFAFGPLGSYIIVSEEWITQLDDSELESLFIHEMSHIKRNDSTTGIILGMCHRLMFISPLSHDSFRAFNQAREEAVDDMTVRTSGRPLALASCLVKAARFARGQKYPAASTGFLSSSKSVENRIRRLLNYNAEENRSPGRHRWLFFSVVSILSIVLLVTI